VCTIVSAPTSAPQSLSATLARTSAAAAAATRGEGGGEGGGACTSIGAVTDRPGSCCSGVPVLACWCVAE